MATIILEDDLINKVVELGHYQTPEHAVIAILSDYIKSHSLELGELYLDVDMVDGEIDSLFECDKDIGSL
jgi:hypothetical protein